MLRGSIRVLILVVWFVAGSATAQSSGEHELGGSPDPRLPRTMLVESDASVRLISEGRSALIDFRLEDAEAYFTHLSNRYDGRAAGMYHLALVSFVRYLMSDREVDMTEFVLRSDELRRTLQDESSSPWRHLLGAETNLQRAVVWAKQGRYVRAALAGRNAYRTYKDLVTTSPEFVEAYKGYGLLKVAIASLPSTYRKFLSLMGFSGNSAEGFRALRFSARDASYMGVEASIYLSMFDIVLDGSRGDGGDRLRALYRQYPDSPLFAHLYGYYLFENRRAREAEAVFRTAESRRPDSDVFYIEYVDHFLGMTLFRQNRFEEAIPYLQRYRETHEGEALRAPTLLHLGLALEMTGERERATMAYREVNATRELDADAVSNRRAQRLLVSPLTETERILLRGANAFDAGDYTAAQALLLQVRQDPTATVDTWAEASYRMGRTYQAMGAFVEALSSYEDAVALRGGNAARWAPWSEYYAGEIYEGRGQVVDAIAAYERALGYPGRYDYYQALENNARIALNRVKAAS